MTRPERSRFGSDAHSVFAKSKQTTSWGGRDLTEAPLKMQLRESKSYLRQMYNGSLTLRNPRFATRFARDGVENAIASGSCVHYFGAGPRGPVRPRAAAFPSQRVPIH